MHKILIEVKKNNLSFSLYQSKEKVENLNNTNIINTEKMIFSDSYINSNLELIKSFFNLVVLKSKIDTVIININSLTPFVFQIINDIDIPNIILTEDKNVNYYVFEALLNSKYIKSIDCYCMAPFMIDKLDQDKNINVNIRCEILSLSNFMDSNNFTTYSDIFYKKSVDIDCNLNKYDKDDIESFFRINSKVKTVHIYNSKEEVISFILELLKLNNKKNIRIVFHQKNNTKDIIKLVDKITNKYKKLFKDNHYKTKIIYTKEYRDKNTMKQVNLTFFRLILITFVLLAILGIIIFYINYKEDTDDINEEIDSIGEAIDLNEIEEYIEEEENLDEEEEEEKETVSSPYYTSFEQVFSKLLEINDETVGWLKVNNTNINYPVTQHSDNEYYLNYSYYKQRNSHGWVFMDYRNSIDELDTNTIIYGHRNTSGLMFGTLKNVLEKSWYTNTSNQVITFNTLNKDMKWQIFSIYTLKNTNDYLITNFNSEENYQDFLDMIEGRSIYDFKVDVSTSDKILTLSTCYNNAEYRLVVHAKLIS